MLRYFYLSFFLLRQW